MPKAKVDGYEADDERNLKKFIGRVKHRLRDYTNTRLSRRVATINRRLDSLARLLERGQICVAVRYDPRTQRIIISSNAIHSTSRISNQSIKQITDLMVLLAQHEATMEEVVEELSKIIADNIYQEHRFQLNGRSLEALREKIKELLNDLLQSGEKTKIWEKAALQGEKGLNADLIRRSSRLARDFMKLRRSILHLTHDDEGATLRAIRDRQFRICRTGGKNMHAEMRQTKELTAEDGEKPYVGLSKLCCARCALVVETQHIPTRGFHGKIFNAWEMPSFFRRNPAARRELLDERANAAYELLSSRDQKQALKMIEDGQQMKPSKGRKTKMLASDSSSDEAFGLSDASLTEAESFELSALLEAIEEKECNPSAYHALRESGGLSAAEMLALIGEPEKYQQLSHEGARKILETQGVEPLETLHDTHPELLDYLNEHTELSNYLLNEHPDFLQTVVNQQLDIEKLFDIFNEDEELLEYILRDDAELLHRAGLTEAIEYYEKALQTQREMDPRDATDFDVNTAAKNAYEEEEGLSYDECSDDSENRYRYRSNSDADEIYYDQPATDSDLDSNGEPELTETDDDAIDLARLTIS